MGLSPAQRRDRGLGGNAGLLEGSRVQKKSAPLRRRRTRVQQVQLVAHGAGEKSLPLSAQVRTKDRDSGLFLDIEYGGSSHSSAPPSPPIISVPGGERPGWRRQSLCREGCGCPLAVIGRRKKAGGGSVSQGCGIHAAATALDGHLQSEKSIAKGRGTLLPSSSLGRRKDLPKHRCLRPAMDALDGML